MSGAGVSGQDETAARVRLGQIIRERSFGRRRIVLASGRESDFYFDMKPTMMDAEGASLLARLLLSPVRASGASHAGGLAMGAVPITGALCQHSFEAGFPIKGFFVRKQVKGHGAKNLIEGLAPGETLSGKRVVMLEDVTTTGESVLQAVDACREAGATIALILSIVDRQEGARETISARGLAFHALFTANEFLMV